MNRLLACSYCLTNTCILLAVLVSVPSTAQVIPDETLPSNSNVTQLQNTNTIDGGTQVGSNLFHSFEQFSITTGDTAYFNNANNIQNIFSRVTGKSFSSIDGLIRANGTANLFLLNPNGIIFGSNARLDIGGSFIGSTADNINFGDRVEFSATNPQAQLLLTVSVPIGLGFGSNPGAIRVQGSGHNLSLPLGFSPVVRSSSASSSTGLRVQPDKTLALVGGDVAIDGGILTAEGGRIDLGSVADGFVSLNSTSSGWKLDYAGVQSFRNIQMSQKALVDTSGSSGGFIQLQGRQVLVRDGSVVLVQNQGIQPSGSLNVNASELLELSGSSPDGNIPSILRTEARESGNGGEISVFAKQLTLRDGAGIGTRTFSNAKGGDLTINTSDSVELLGFSSFNPFFTSGISASTRASGNAGNITISTGQLKLQDGGTVTSLTRGLGAGGNVTVNANESVELINSPELINPESNYLPSNMAATAFQTGNAGSLTINTSRLFVGKESEVNSSTVGAGNAGAVTINALKSIEINGAVGSAAIEASEETQKIFGSPPTPSGNSGEINFNTNKLSITNSGVISVRNEGKDNAAGVIRINANTINLDNDGSIAAATFSGEGGDIFINSRNLQLQNGSSISATAGLAGGGGNGGNITIDTDTLTALAGSSITANAFTGRGGNIQITTQGLFRSPDSIFSASSEFGVDGTLDIRTFGLEPDEALVPLNQVFIPTEQVVANSCLARRNKSKDRFVITGSGGLPESPSDSVMPMPLFSDRGLEQSLPQRGQSSTPTLWQEGDPVVEATGIVKTEDGRTLLGMAASSVPDAESAICR